MPVLLQDVLKAQGRSNKLGALPCAVVTMELQRGVMGDLASFPDLAAAAKSVGVPEHAGELAALARELHIPVVHCTAEFRSDRAGTLTNTPLHTTLLRNPAHLLEETPATELIPELRLSPADIVLPRRHGVSPFTGTDLDATLRNLGVQTLIVTGVSLNIGVLGLSIEGVNLGYHVVIATDAVCGVPLDFGQEILTHSLGLLAILATTAEILVALRSEGAPGQDSL